MAERCDQSVKKTGNTNLIYERLRKMPLAGISFACLAGLAAATDGLLVNEIPEVDTYQAVVFRSLAQLTTFIPLAIWFGWSFRAAKGESWPLLGRNVLATTALLTSFWSFRLMPLGDASTIVASSPMFATFFGCLVIGEACGVFEMTVLAATAVGIVLISKPTFLFSGQASDADTLSGTICASIASLSIGLEFVVMRKLQKTPVGVIVFWFAVLELVASMTAIFILYNVPGPQSQMAESFLTYRVVDTDGRRCQ
ncbi:Solute carrier family 35 member G1 [Halotydeus destructor]|nr:Solute carrier family 35 member G1 [Halotydeus destructor]